MEFDKMKAQVKNVALETTRMDNEDYFEAVIGHARLEEVIHVLENIFGVPAWPSDKKPLKDTGKLIKSAGGLREGQTLYFLDNKSGCPVFAMLWPWRDGERITIKIGKT